MPDEFIVRILAPDGQPAGVGVLVSGRHILTCAHVVNAALGRGQLTQDRPGEVVLVDFPVAETPHAPLRARVERWAPPPTAEATGDDVAGLTLTGTGPPAGAVIARLAVEEPRPGRPVRVFGCPEGRPDGQWTSATIRERVGNGRFQLDSDSVLPIRRGFSGSPVFDPDIGRVVGLVAMAPLRSQDPDSYAIGARQLRLAWPEVLGGRRWRGRSAASGEHTADEITVLHLSGTRFGATRSPDAYAALTDDLAWLADSRGPRPDLLVVTGDLTEGGRPREFERAFGFLGALAEATEIPRRHVAIVPGSHDVNLTACRGYFEEQEDCGEQAVPPYFPKWKWLAAALTEFYGDQEVFTPDEPWTLFDMPELSVVVAGLNSTMPHSHRDQGSGTGDHQLRWFAQRLEEYRRRRWLRLAAVHRPDPRTIDGYLGVPGLASLVLHGHAGEALASGLATLSVDDAPPERYQLVTVDPEGLTRYARRYAAGKHRWTGDTGISPDGTDWICRTDCPLESTDATFRADRTRAGVAFTRPDDQPRGSAPAFFELVQEATQARWPRATVNPRPAEAYLRVSQPLATGGAVPHPVGVVDTNLSSVRIDAFAAGVHAAFKAADPQVQSVLVYGGPPASGQLVAYARTRGVSLQSFTEYQGLLDLRPLADKQREELARDPHYPAQRYIEQRYRVAGRHEGFGEVQTGLVARVSDWLGAEESRLVMVLGDFGRGKTAFLKQLTRTLPAKLPAVLPILVELRGLEKAPTLERLLVQYLVDRVDDINLGKLEYMIGSGRIALLFDGFDELELRVGYDNAADYLRTMLNSVANRAKIVITSRTQHFVSTRQVRTALGTQVEALTSSRLVLLEDLAEDQMIEFLAGRYDGSQKRARARFELLGAMGNLLELARNPRMLTFVATLDEERLRAMHDQGGGQISAADLYREIIDFWLAEEATRQQHPRGLRSLGRDERFHACTALALRMWESGETTIGLGDLSEEVSATLAGLAERGYSEEHAAHAIGSGSLLVRAGDGTFRFVHQSIMEWLVAAAAADELHLRRTSEILSGRPMTRTMGEFLFDLAGHEWMLSWMKATLRDETVTGVARQNAAQIAGHAGVPLTASGPVNLARADLRDQDLAGRDLRGANLRGANLRGMRLRDVDLSGANLTDADLREVRMTGGSIEAATLIGSRWDRAALLGTAGIDQARSPELDVAAFLGRDAADVMVRPPSGPSRITFSADGTLLAAASGDVAEIIDAAEGRVLRVLCGHKRSISCIAFSPDSAQLVTASIDCTTLVWDLTTGTTRIALRHPDWVTGVAYSPDGAQLATAFRDGTTRVWDLSSGTGYTLAGHDGPVQSVAYSPDGSQLATASSDHTVRVWDVPAGTVHTTLAGHEDVVTGVAFSPDGTLLATASMDCTARVWDLATGTTRTTLTGHTRTLRDVAFSPDGTMLATASSDRTVRIWDLSTGTTRTSLGSRRPMTDVAFSPDSALLATSSDRIGHIWDLATGTTRITLTGHDDAVNGVAFSPDGRLLATGFRGGTARLWDLATGTARTTLTGHDRAVNGVAFSCDGTLLATASDDHSVRIWDLVTGTTRMFPCDRSAVYGAAFSPDATRLVTVSSDGTARVWDLASGTILMTLTGHQDSVRRASFSPDGSQLATASADGTTRIWDLATGQSDTILSGHSPMTDVAFSPDGSQLATASSDGAARIWDLATGQAHATLSGHSPVTDVAFSPGGGQLATASADGTIHVWDLASGNAGPALTGHLYQIRGITFSPDGTRLASASSDGTTRVWDVDAGRELVTLIALDDDGYAALLPDGKYKLEGDPGDRLWWAIKLCRFRPGELDPYVPGLERLPAEAPLP